MIIVDRAGAQRTILDAVNEANGLYPEAAKALGCSLTVLYKWIEQLGIGQQADGMRATLKADARAKKKASTPKAKRVRTRKPKAQPAEAQAL